jgi:hypothetical protein
MSDQNVMSEEAYQAYQEKLQERMTAELAAAPRGNTGLVQRRIIKDKYQAFGLGQPAPSTQQQQPSQEELEAAFKEEMSRIPGNQTEARILLRQKYRRQGLSI